MNLSDYLKSPGQTGFEQGQAANQAVGNPYAIGKNQSANSGMQRNPAMMYHGQGQAFAQRQASPLATAMSNAFANQGWLGQKAASNEGYTLNNLANMQQAFNINNNPAPQIMQNQFANQMYPWLARNFGLDGMMGSLFGGA